MANIFLRKGDAFVMLREQPYEAETVLQELIAKHPELLADDDAESGTLLLIRREAGVSGAEDAGARWSLDHLYLDAAGVPTLVEVKRSSDTRGRREVVAQMLDYAANAATSWSVEQLRAWLDEDAQRRGSTADESLREAFGTDHPEAYWQTVRTNLAAERLRLVFVSDAIPPELRRIIEFLNDQMTDTTVLAIEVKQYVDTDGTHQTIVPRVVGQTQHARQTKGAPSRTSRMWDLESVLARLAHRSPEEAQIARRLVDRLGARPGVALWFGTGAHDSSVLFGRDGSTRGLLAVYTTGTVEVRFMYLMERAPFDQPGRIEAFIEELNEIPGVSFPADETDWPNSRLLGLSATESFDRFTRSFERAFAEIAAAA